jgi:hypothetical protein
MGPTYLPFMYVYLFIMINNICHIIMIVLGHVNHGHKILKGLKFKPSLAQPQSNILSIQSLIENSQIKSL